MISINLPPVKTKKQIESFFIKKGLISILKESKKKKSSVNGKINNEPFIPQLGDLYRLYEFIVLNKRTTIMEFGSGRSANAKFLKDHFKRKWRYLNDQKNDQHIFWLVDPLLGMYNKLQIDFYKKK